MTRQIAILLGIVILILALTQMILYLKPRKPMTVHFKEGAAKKEEIRGWVTKKERYIIVEPEDGSDEQVFTWDQVRDITGTETPFNKRIDEVSDLLELVAKLGVLAAAGVFLIGLYQFNVGQTWKSEEFLAGTINDFGRRANVENAKRMIEMLMFYRQQGREINFEPDNAQSKPVKIEPAQVSKALDPTEKSELNEVDMRIRECFDAFFSRLERFEHYIRAKLVTEQSVYVYLNYWIDILINWPGPGDPDLWLQDEHRDLLMNYVAAYRFPMLERLLDRYRRDKRWLRKVREQMSAPARPVPVRPPAPSTEQGRAR